MSRIGSFFSAALGLLGAVALAPFSAGTSLAAYAGWLMAASVVVGTVDSIATARRERRAARAAYNAALEDRLEMIDVTPDQARSIVYGRVRTVEGIRRRWVSGANSEKLTMVISFAGHQIDGFETFYFDDTPLTLDAQGYVTTAPYAKGARENFTRSGVVGTDGLAVVQLPSGTEPSSLVGTTASGPVDAQVLTQLQLVGVNAGTTQATFRGEPLSNYTVSGQHVPFKPTARIRAFTGAPGQNIGALLAAEYPGKITATDRFEGMAVAVVDLDYDPDVYPQGRPNITAVLRGRRVYDPRLDSTVVGGSGPQRLADRNTWAFSENPSLHFFDFARDPAGWAVPAQEVQLQDVIDTANACDVPTTFTLRKIDGSVSSVTLPRYRCAVVIKSEGGRGAPADEIVSAMAGRWGWAGGQLRFRAGQRRAVSFAMDASWIVQRVDERGQPDSAPVVRLANGTPRDQRLNRVSGRCVHPGERWQVLPFPAVQDPVLIARDGAVHALEIDMAAVSHPAHAQHLAKIRIREAQAPLTMTAQCSLAAFGCELFDVGSVTLPRFGMAGKTFEVEGWRWHPSEGVQLTLGELTDEIFSVVDELRGLDPAPNSTLRSPWDVSPVVGLTVESGTAALADGSVLTRTRLTWSPVAQASVLVGGQIEIQYCEQRTGQWQSWTEPGSATQAVIPGLRAGVYYLFKVRAVQGVPSVRGPWSPHLLHRIGAVAVVAGRYTEWIFIRSATQPATPTGNGLPAGWSDAPPAPNGHPLWASTADKRSDGTLIGSWSAPVQLEGASVRVEYSLNGLTGWHAPALASDRWMRFSNDNGVTWGAPIKFVGEDGTDGIDGLDGPPGTRTATLVMYQWAPSAPTTFPQGTSYYTWATATYTDPVLTSGWTQVPTAPVPGWTLYQVLQTIVDETRDTMTAVPWTSTVARAVGQAGTVGLRGSVTGYSATVSPPIYSTGTPWAAGDDYGASMVIWRMRGNAGVPPNNAHLVIGDTVTLTNTAVTAAATRYWTGGSWVDPGAVFSGNVIVGGTIAGQTNLGIAGWAKIEGAAGLTVTDPRSNGSWVTAACVQANTAQAQPNGIVGFCGPNGFGLLGIGPTLPLGTITSQVGVGGFGPTGVLGSTTVTGGTGVQGRAASGTGVSGDGAIGVWGRGNTGVEASSDYGTALSAWTYGGKAGAFKGRVSVTQEQLVLEGTASMLRLKTTANSSSGRGAFVRCDSDALRLGVTSQGDADGWAAGWPITVRWDMSVELSKPAWNVPLASGGSSYEWRVGKPGGYTTGMWVPLTVNGVQGDVLWFPRS